jgi:hypothetical protein
MYSQPAILNVLDLWYYNGSAYVGMQANNPSVAQQNALVLQQIIEYAQTTNCDQTATYGAIILFPGHDTLVDPTVGGTGDDDGSTYYIATQPGKAYVAHIECNWPLLFKGTGSTKLSMVVGESTPGGDIFYVDTGNGNNDNTGGVTFEDLTFVYPGGISTAEALEQWAAIHLPGGGDSAAQNVRVSRCIFEDCPLGIWAENALQLSVLECLMEFRSSGNVGTCIILGDATSGDAAKEVFITDCLFAAGKAPNGSTAIQILGSDEIFVEDCHIDGFTDGIAIVPGPTGHNAVHLHFSGCTVYTGVDGSDTPNLGRCCIIQPQPDTSGSEPVPGVAQVGEVIFTGCIFELGASVTEIPGTTGPGILVDATYGAVGLIRFVSCQSTRWPGPGLEVTGNPTGTNLQPANIEVLGGIYAGNLEGGTLSSPSCGIYLDVVQGARVSGASCVGSYYKIVIDSTHSAESPQQEYGIYIDAGASSIIVANSDCRNNSEAGIYVEGGASDVIIDACDLRGNGTNGIYVDASTTAVTDVFVRNCNARGSWAYNAAINVSGSGSNASTVQVTNTAGYNDQGVTLHTAMPTSGTAFYSYSFANTYYGPVEFYTQPGLGTISMIFVDGQLTGLKQGSFFLQPGEYALIDWSGSGLDVPTFAMIGK